MDAMDLDIDMDLDVDAGEITGPDLHTHDLEAQALAPILDAANTEDSAVPVPTKIHICGLDVLNPEHIKSYVGQCYTGTSFDKIEWIDDSSANLVYSSEAVAQEVLTALSSVEIGNISRLPLLELLPAKPYSEMPEVKLQVRLAVASDKKQVGAASRSRFYLLNPDYDPETRRRYRDRDGEHKRRGRGRGQREPREEDTFDVNLYDDDEAALARRAVKQPRRRPRSNTPEVDEEEQRRRSRQPSNQNKELFPDRSRAEEGYLRGRSASPLRDGDGDRVVDDALAADRTARRNRDKARAIKDRLSRSSNTKELFPDSTSSFSRGRLGDKADKVADQLASQMAVPLMDGSDDAPRSSVSLAERITLPGERRFADRLTAPGEVKLADRITNPGEGISIRGTAGPKGLQQGFAIKGGAGKTVKELFPEKFGSNTGKELFGDKLEGRGRRRQKAEDLFY